MSFGDVEPGHPRTRPARPRHLQARPNTSSKTSYNSNNDNNANTISSNGIISNSNSSTRQAAADSYSSYDNSYRNYYGYTPTSPAPQGGLSGNGYGYNTSNTSNSNMNMNRSSSSMKGSGSSSSSSSRSKGRSVSFQTFQTAPSDRSTARDANTNTSGNTNFNTNPNAPTSRRDRGMSQACSSTNATSGRENVGMNSRSCNSNNYSNSYINYPNSPSESSLRNADSIGSPSARQSAQSFKGACSSSFNPSNTTDQINDLHSSQNPNSSHCAGFAPFPSNSQASSNILGMSMNDNSGVFARSPPGHGGPAGPAGPAGTGGPGGPGGPVGPGLGPTGPRLTPVRAPPRRDDTSDSAMLTAPGGADLGSADPYFPGTSGTSSSNFTARFGHASRSNSTTRPGVPPPPPPLSTVPRKFPNPGTTDPGGDPTTANASSETFEPRPLPSPNVPNVLDLDDDDDNDNNSDGGFLPREEDPEGLSVSSDSVPPLRPGDGEEPEEGDDDWLERKVYPSDFCKDPSTAPQPRRWRSANDPDGGDGTPRSANEALSDIDRLVLDRLILPQEQRLGLLRCSSASAYGRVKAESASPPDFSLFGWLGCGPSRCCGNEQDNPCCPPLAHDDGIFAPALEDCCNCEFSAYHSAAALPMALKATDAPRKVVREE